MFATKDLFIFDLDGTLFNTLGDLAPAVNFALKQFGIAEISQEDVRMCIGNGSMNLIRRAITTGITQKSGNSLVPRDIRNFDAVTTVLNNAFFDDTKVTEIHQVYSAYYWEHCTENTIPYEGVIEILKRINAIGKTAVMLTNKPVAPSEKILRKFGLISAETPFEDSVQQQSSNDQNLIAAYLCGDTTPERKPSPKGIQALLAQFETTPEKAVMIGDDTPDILAARNAGIDCITLLEGFGKTENLMPLQPQYTIGHIKDLLKEI